MLDPTPDEVARVCAYLANVAAGVSHQAGVGGIETAGQFVSFLAANPDRAADFVADLIMIEDVFDPSRGCLSWHAVNGRIVHPSDMRAMKGQPDA